MAPVTFEYRFLFSNGIVKDFFITLSREDCLYSSQHSTVEPWTKLTYHQCPCCPLTEQQKPYCPIALNLTDLVTAFKDTTSFESCHVSCRTAERLVSKNTLVQDGLSSIMGIIMATSGCPVMDILKPLARFHLPFATVDESMFRSISVYLLRQYFNHLNNGVCDFRLENVKEYYHKIEQVNGGILERIKHATKMDADRNAIVILNCLAQILYIELDENFQSLKPYFEPL